MTASPDPRRDLRTNKPETWAAYLRDLGERLMHVPVTYGTDQLDAENLREMSKELARVFNDLDVVKRRLSGEDVPEPTPPRGRRNPKNPKPGSWAARAGYKVGDLVGPNKEYVLMDDDGTCMPADRLRGPIAAVVVDAAKRMKTVADAVKTAAARFDHAYAPGDFGVCRRCGAEYAEHEAADAANAVASKATIDAARALSGRRSELRALIKAGEITVEEARKEFPESF